MTAASAWITVSFPVAGVHTEPVPAWAVKGELTELRVVGAAPVQYRDGAFRAFQVGLGYDIPATATACGPRLSSSPGIISSPGSMSGPAATQYCE